MQTKTRGKRHPILMLLVIIMLISSQYSTAFSEYVSIDTYRLFSNGIEYSSDNPIIKVDNEMYAPVRLIAESMSMTVSWNGTTQELSYEMDGNILNMKIGSGDYTYNGISGTTLQKPLIYSGRTYVPLRFIAEIFGFSVTIDETGKRIELYKGTPYILYIDGRMCDSDPIYKDGDEYWICMRDIVYNGQFSVKWESVSQEFSMTDSKNSFYLKVDSGDYTFNGVPGKIVPLPRVKIYEGRHDVYLPLKFMMALYKIPLEIDEVNKTLTVNINTINNERVSGLEIYNTNFNVFANVKPKPVTRAELSRFLVKSFALNTNVTATQLFRDVTPDNEYFKDIYLVKKDGLLNGYVNGEFKPEGYMTRAEYAYVLITALKYDITKNDLVINDISGSWAEDYIKTAVDAGLMELNADNCFEPTKYISFDVSGQIIPIISPSNAKNKKVIWKSDNENIAVVDKTGHITGISPGNAVITCTTEDGGISKICYVNVKSEEPVIYGYIKPGVESGNENIYSGFKVEIAGTDRYVLTDSKGYFKIPVSDSESLESVRILKPGYLTRKLLVNSFGELSTKESPIIMRPGDIDGNGCINLMDIMEMAKSYNSASGDAMFNSNYDFDTNGVINLSDVLCAAKWFGSLSDDTIQ